VVEVGGGGAVWDAVSYDPEANLIYVGTGQWLAVALVPARIGTSGFYICSILAVNPEQRHWHGIIR